MENDDSKIIPFTGLKPTISPKRHDNQLCKHTYVLVDEKNRMVECETCGKIIDPFDYMWHEAINQDYNLRVIGVLKREVKNLTEQKERLEKEVYNLKAKKKRLS